LPTSINSSLERLQADLKAIARELPITDSKVANLIVAEADTFVLLLKSFISSGVVFE